MLITHRLLRLIEHIHLLIPSLRSAAISTEEEALRAKLEKLKDEVQRGLGSGGGRGRVNELWALLGAVKAAKERDAGSGRDGVEWKVVDQDGLERLALVRWIQRACWDRKPNFSLVSCAPLIDPGGATTGPGSFDQHYQ